MRNLLALLGAVLVTFAVVGWYLDWYRLRSNPAQDGHQSVNIDIDRDKIGKDLQRGSERLHNAIDRTKQDAAAPEKSPATVPGKPSDSFW